MRRDTWVAQSVKRLILGLGSVPDLRVTSFKFHVGPNMEPTLKKEEEEKKNMR